VKLPSAATDVGETTVVERRVLPDAPAVPAWKVAFNDYDGNVDLWVDMERSAGSNMMLDVGVTPTVVAP
jgi:hypothetical protein